MQHLGGIEAFTDKRRTVITLGKFDGLHRGHQKLIDCVQEVKEADMASVVFQFDMSELYKSRNQKEYMIMSREERMMKLAGKIDYLLECPFTDEIRTLEAEAFLKDILIGKLHAAKIVVGTDYQFGYCQKGNVHTLEAYASKYHYDLFVIEKERYGERIISSSYIKEALAKGNLPLANELLGYPYMVTGMVERGEKLGRTLGFPTLNIPIQEGKMLPSNGVYLSRTYVKGKWYKSITNIGVKPTVSNCRRTLAESHLLDAEGDLYGETVIVELLCMCRAEQRFSSVEELKQQVDKDIAYGRSYFFES